MTLGRIALARIPSARVLGGQHVDEREHAPPWRRCSRPRRRTVAAPRARRRRRSRHRRRPAGAAIAAWQTRYVGRRFSRSCASKSSTGVSCTRPPVAKPPTRLTTARSGASSSPAASAGDGAAESASDRSAGSSTSRSCAGHAVALGRVEDRHDDAPAGVEERLRDGGAEPPVPPVMSALRGHARERYLFAIRAVRPRRLPPLLPCSCESCRRAPSVECVLVVREAELRCQARRRPSTCASMLGDRTGSLPANIWDDVATIAEVAIAGAAVRVSGRLQVSARHGAELELRAICAAEPGTFDLADARRRAAALGRPDGARPARAARDRPGLRPAPAARTPSSARTRRCGRAIARRRRRSASTRPTATGCSSTRCRWPRR